MKRPREDTNPDVVYARLLVDNFGKDTCDASSLPNYAKFVSDECHKVLKEPPLARGQFTVDSISGEGIRRVYETLRLADVIPLCFDDCKRQPLPEKQREMLMMMLRCSLQNIVGYKEFSAGQEKYCKMMGIEEVRSFGAILAPRQAGKSQTTGIAAAIEMIVAPGIIICSYASNKAQAKVIQQKYTRRILLEVFPESWGPATETCDTEGMLRLNHGNNVFSRFKAFTMNS